VSLGTAPAQIYGSSVALEPDQSRTIQPGDFAIIHVKSRAVVHLAAGTYRFHMLAMEPQARVVADGPVRLIVANQLVDRGSLQGFEGSAVTFFGASEIVLGSGAVGALTAQNALVVVRGAFSSGRMLAWDLLVDAARVLTCNSSYAVAAPPGQN